MLKNLLILSSFLILTACQSVPVKMAETKKSELPTSKINGDSDQDGVPDDIDQCPNTPLNVVVNAKGCPVSISGCDYPMPPELRVFYEKDSAFPPERYLSEIVKMAEKLTEFPKSTIAIEGHASKTDKNPANISHERAVTVAQILKEKYGISEKRITINSYGIERPIADNKLAEGRRMNQRIYAIIANN